MTAMRSAMLLACILGTLLPPLAAGAVPFGKENAMTIYLSPQGNDAAAGTREAPVATLARACALARGAKGATIQVSGGEYPLTAPVTLGSEHSGLTIAAATGEAPLFTGAVALSRWKRVETLPAGVPATVTGQLWAAPLPGGTPIAALYLGEQRLPLAMTSPADDWERWPAAAPGATRDTLLLPKELARPWANPTIMRMNFLPTLYTYWKNVVTPVLGVEGNVLRFDERALPTILAVPKRVPLRFENVPECLAPGTWYQADGTLYLWPPPGVDPTAAELTAPALGQALILQGDEGAGNYVRNVTLRGLAFARFGDGALISLEAVEDCAVERCTISRVEGQALRITRYAKRVRVQGNHIYDCGRGAVAITGHGFGTRQENRDHQVTDNTIHHCGRVDWHAAGVQVGAGAGYVTIAHNHIHHMPYSCVSTGASKIREYKFAVANPDSPRARSFRLDEIGDAPLTVEGVKRFTAGHVTIEANDCHDFMLMLDDGGAIYAHATHHTVVRGNRVVRSGRPNAFGLYFDDEELDSVMEDNLVALCPPPGQRQGSGAALHIHDNGRNAFRNNIFALSYRLVSFPNSYGGLQVERNILLFQGGCGITHPPKTVRGPGDGRRQPDWDAGPSTMDRNLYWCLGDGAAAETLLATLQKGGWDAHSVAADPQFADPAKLDFTLPPDSPALKRGFKPFDLSNVGPREGWKVAETTSASAREK